MKRTILSIAAIAALTAPAARADAPALPQPRAYFVLCGATAMVLCGFCVEYGDVSNCTRW